MRQYDEPPPWWYYEQQRQRRGDPVARALFAATAFLVAFGAALYFGGPYLRSIQLPQPPAPVVPTAYVPPVRPPVAQQPPPPQIIIQQPAPQVEQAPTVPPEPAVSHGSRPNVRTYESQPTQAPIVIYPTAAPPAPEPGVNLSSDVHIGSDGFSIGGSVSVTNDAPDEESTGARVNTAPQDTKGARPNTRSYK